NINEYTFIDISPTHFIKLKHLYQISFYVVLSSFLSSIRNLNGANINTKIKTKPINPINEYNHSTNFVKPTKLNIKPITHVRMITGYVFRLFSTSKKRDRKSTRLNSSHVSISY